VPTAGKPRQILALLALYPGRVVPVQTLLEELRARVAELEELLVAKDRPVDEDPIAHALTDKATALEENVEPQVRRLRALLAGQREDAAAEADGITRRIAPTQALREETRAAQ
ncbi:hypothetical protein ACWGRA_28845, partial [Streptomyces albidoflavus]